MQFDPNLRRVRPAPKKKKGLRWRWLLASALALAVCVGLWAFFSRKEDAGTPGSAYTYGEIVTHTQDEVNRVAVTLHSGESWAIVRREDGEFVLEDDPDFVVSSSRVNSLTRAASVVSYDEILTEDAADYQDRLDEFGLDEPTVTASFTYDDGTTATIRVGSASPLDDETWYYMLLEGDDRLLSVDKGTVDDLLVERSLLHPVTQPTIHKARLDAITLTGADGQIQAAWELNGSITDDDAASRWYLTVPYVYPTDSDSMDNVRSNIANLRLGAYVGEATEENMAAYGMTEPRFVITIHMAAGAVNSTDDDGSVVPVDWPEATLVFTVGGEKNENVDYVMYDGCIYITSHYSLDIFMQMDGMSTVTRYPVNVPLEKLSSLQVNGDTYLLSREAETDEDGNIIYDDDGEAVYDLTVMKNGEPYPSDVFEAAYARLEVVTVSGSLPDGWTPTEEPHTTYVFKAVSGRTHTVTLSRYDALHDAVTVDGCSLFYLIHDGMVWNASETADGEATE